MIGIRLILIIGIGVLALCLAPPAAFAAPAEIHVKVMTHEGEPLEDVLLGLFVDRKRVVDATTDADGRATIRSTVDEGVVAVGHGFAYGASSFGKERQYALAKRIIDLTKEYHFAFKNRLKLSPEQDRYELTITAWAAVDVTARIVDEKGQPQRGGLWGPKHSWPGLGEAGDPLRLISIRRGVDTQVCASSHGSWPAVVIKPIALTAAQTQDDLNLGDVIVPSHDHGAPIDLTITGDAAIRQLGAGTPLPGIMFVAADGALAIVYRAVPITPDDKERLTLMVKPEEPAFLEPGKYYLAPGEFLYTEDQMALIRLVRSGDKADLSGLVSIDVPEEGLKAEINLLAALEGIRKAAGQLEEEAMSDKR